MIERFPYVPADPATRDERCKEVYNIQVHGLLAPARDRVEKLVIGVSGGLDSTHALLVCAAAMDRLGLPRATSSPTRCPASPPASDTLGQARRLMRRSACTAQEIDIRPRRLQMLKDIGHPSARGEKVYDITFENVQAGERTGHLFRLANFHGGFVVGTGDLSELALGWCTYGVGDHMSHYNVNASVPKTLIRYLVRWASTREQFGDAATTRCCRRVLATADQARAGAGRRRRHSRRRAARTPSAPTSCRTSTSTTSCATATRRPRSRSSPTRLARPRARAVAGLLPTCRATSTRWPRSSSCSRVFLALLQDQPVQALGVPNAPKVGSGGSLSPRGDWRAPSDSEATVWLDELRANVPD